MASRWNGIGRALRRLGGDGRGNAAVEFALSMPALLLFVFGIMEMGRLLWIQNALNYSVAEAARCASNSSNCSSTAQVQSYAAARSGASFATSVFSVSSASCGNQVSASYPISLSIPYVPISITLSAQACYPS